MKAGLKYSIYIITCLVMISIHFSHAMLSQTIGKQVITPKPSPVATTSKTNFNMNINTNKNSLSNYYATQKALSNVITQKPTLLTPQNITPANKNTNNTSHQTLNKPGSWSSNWKNWLTYLGIGLGLSEFISELYDDLVAQQVTEATVQDIESQAVQELQILANKSQVDIDNFIKKNITKLSTTSESLSTLIFLLELVKNAPNADTKKKIGIAISNNIIELGESFCKGNRTLANEVICIESTKKYIIKTLKHLIQLDPNSIINSTVFAVLKSTKPYALIIARFIPTAITGNIQFKILSSAISHAPFIVDRVRTELKKAMGTPALTEQIAQPRSSFNWRTIIKKKISDWWYGK